MASKTGVLVSIVQDFRNGASLRAIFGTARYAADMVSLAGRKFPRS
jgi:hypothetical protein